MTRRGERREAKSFVDPLRDPSRLAVEDRATWRSIGFELRWHERLHAFVICGSHAFVLVDTNSDGREIEVNMCVDRGGAWERFGPLQEDIEAGGASGYGWACGHAPASSIVRVDYGEDSVDVRANSAGWWGFVASDGEHIPVADVLRKL